ncbi:zinc finger with UFM1-specific peptidase domain protein isoform X1 [Astyanax mexicanus]|uniref:Zinc finger-containing ubiquitin peptidase 1 n=1 Tax=Astyanax mexicanus TaxID=7994 RepID=A0A8T2M5B3_ASTMX|nr:zinc finger with UFM1-specific peptidase domain protein isoform X1 [Astyanax mexicanus]
MPVCDICCQEFASESELKTHLLLSHLENEMSCPFCSLSGVSYDELNFHISTAHTEMDLQNSPTDKASADRVPDPTETNGAKWTVKNSPASCNSWRTPASPQTSGHHTLKTANETAAPSAGIALTQGQGAQSRIKSSPPAASTASASKKQTSSVHPGQSEDYSAEHCKAKQKRLSSPKKERMFPCPFCSLVCSDCFILQEHVELHLQDQASSASEGTVPEAGASAQACSSVRNGEPGFPLYECPLCSLVCVDNSSLQEHVELHLEYGTAAAAAGDLSGDLKLARQLQEEDEKKRKEEEAKREKEDFRQLKKVFGLDNSGGYRRQLERNMERAVSRGHMDPAEFHQKRAEMMESLASGVDDGRSRTNGVLEALYDFHQREARDCARVWLCAETDHYSSSAGDKGWGCGYRNFQMLLSALRRTEEYTAPHTLPDAVPSIPRVQALIEAAWAEGIDPQGASHFNRKLQGTRAWIGATEIYSVLTVHRIRARIVDFHQPTGPGNTHPRLFDWVKNYFSQHSSRGARLPPRVVKTNHPPIYLQHQGHSRSIVGVEERKNGSVCLLLLDPGCPPGEMRKLLNPSTAAASVSRMRKFPGHLKHTQYQVVTAEGVLTPEEKRERIANSRTLRAERIP